MLGVDIALNMGTVEAARLQQVLPIRLDMKVVDVGPIASIGLGLVQPTLGEEGQTTFPKPLTP